MRMARRIAYLAMMAAAVPLTILIAIPIILLLAFAYYVSLALVLFCKALAIPFRRDEPEETTPPLKPVLSVTSRKP
jgi:hypothetical protein